MGLLDFLTGSSTPTPHTPVEAPNTLQSKQIAANATVAIGVSLAIHGVAQLLAPAPTTNNASAAVDQRQSFLFGGQSNISAQGGPVPLVYGRMRVGSVMVSAGVVTEQLGLAGPFGTSS
jgi:predicted phage tail protein